MIELTLVVSRNQLTEALRGLDYDELLSVMLQLDLMVADCGFTEDLVKGLVKSLKNGSSTSALSFINWEKV